MNTIEADSAVIVDVGVKHLGNELNLGRLCRVFLCELELQLKQTSVPGSSLWTLDEGSPKQEVPFLGRSIDALVLLITHFCKVADQSFFCRSAHDFLINYLYKKIVMKQTYLRNAMQCNHLILSRIITSKIYQKQFSSLIIFSNY